MDMTFQLQGHVEPACQVEGLKAAGVPEPVAL